MLKTLGYRLCSIDELDWLHTECQNYFSVSFGRYQQCILHRGRPFGPHHLSCDHRLCRPLSMIKTDSEILARFRAHLEARACVTCLLHFFFLRPDSRPEEYRLISISKMAYKPKMFRYEPLADYLCLCA